jgi:hypothetical protein
MSIWKKISILPLFFLFFSDPGISLTIFLIIHYAFITDLNFFWAESRQMFECLLLTRPTDPTSFYKIFLQTKKSVCPYTKIPSFDDPILDGDIKRKSYVTTVVQV